MKLPLRRSRRDVEHHGDLAVLVALDVMQHEDLPGAGRQPIDRLLEIESQVDADGRSRREIQRRVFG